MLLQTNSYVVPKEKRAEHARLVRRFRSTLNRLGCDQFDVFEQVGANWAGGETTGRFVQMMRFRDRQHQLAVQNAEKADSAAQQLIAEFCELINFPYQQQQGLFAVGFYQSVLPVAPVRYPDLHADASAPMAGSNGAGLRIVEDGPADDEPIDQAATIQEVGDEIDLLPESAEPSDETMESAAEVEFTEEPSEEPSNEQAAESAVEDDQPSH